MKNLILIGTVLLTFAGCKKETTDNQDTDKPIACFTPSKTTVNVNETVLFTNCTQKAIDHQEWFSENIGTWATDVDASLSWSDAGTHKVKLTVYSANGASDDTVQTITVLHPATVNPGTYSKMKISRIEILSFPATQSNGQDWDNSSVGSAPDMFIQFMQHTFNSGITKVDAFNNLSEHFEGETNTANLKWDYSSSPRIFDLPATYFVCDVLLADSDGSMTYDSQTMANADAIDFYSATYYGKPSITLTQGSFSVRFTLQWQ